MTASNVQTAAGAVPGQEFLAELDQYSARYWHDHPFHARLHAGRLSREQLQAWVANRFYYQKCIPLKDAAIIANCLEVEVRRRWTPRLSAQDGVRSGGGEIEEWRHLALAVGLTAADLDSDALVIPGVRFAADAYVSFARSRSWLEGVAASLSQGYAASLLAVRSDAFERHYPWVDKAAVSHFNERRDRLARESNDARTILAEYCVTRGQQERAHAALAFKSEVLRAMLDALHQAHPASE
jgi:pyrroloquinoline-quinone synthase